MQVFNDLMYLIEDDVLNVTTLQEDLNGVAVKTPFAHSRSELRQGRVRHDHDARGDSCPTLRSLHTSRRPGQHEVRGDPQAERLMAQLAEPLLLIADGGNQDQDRLTLRQRPQPVLNAQHPDHRLTAAGGSLDDLAAIPVALEDGLRLALVRTGMS